MIRANDTGSKRARRATVPPLDSLRRTPVQRHWRKARWLLHRHVLRTPFLEADAIPFGLRFRGHTADHLTRHIRCRGCFESESTQFVLASVRPGPGEVVLDVGANIGWYTLLASRLADPAAEVVAFEPDPDTFALLEDNVARNAARNVRCVNLALGERSDTLELHRGPARNRGRHSLLPLHAGERVRVPVVRLDEWCRAELGDRPIAFLKIDVEGYEGFVLRGAGTLLARCRLLMFEYTPDFMRRAGLDPGALLEQARQAGLRPHVWEDGRLHAVSIERLRASDVQANLIWLK